MYQSSIKESFPKIWRAFINFLSYVFGFKNPGFFWRVIALIFTGSVLTFTVICVIEFNRWPHNSDINSQAEAIHPFYFDENRKCFKNLKTNEVVLKHVVEMKQSEGVSVFMEKDKSYYGYFDMIEGKVIAPPIYRDAWIMRDGIAVALRNDSLFVIERNGNIRSHFKMIKQYFRDPYIFYNGVCAFAVNDSCLGVSDSYGKEWILVGPWKNLQVKAEGIFATDKNNRVSMYDHKGNLVNPFVCQSIEPLYYFSEEDSLRKIANCLAYKTDSRWMGLITPEGKPITDPCYQKIQAIGKDSYLCTYERVGKYGVILNSKGEIIE